MKKNITRMFLLTMILFGFVNLAEADYQENTDCAAINQEVKDYPKKKVKIDLLFDKLSQKDEQFRKKIYSKIDYLIGKYLKKNDKKKKRKLYVILGYLKCQNTRLISDNSIQTNQRQENIEQTNNTQQQESAPYFWIAMPKAFFKAKNLGVGPSAYAVKNQAFVGKLNKPTLSIL